MTRQTKTQVLFGIILSTVLLTGAACVDDDGDDDDISMDTDSSTDTDLPKTTALIITSDGTTGSYATIGLPEQTVTPDIQPIHSDAVCRFDPITGTPFVVSRLGADAVEILDPDAGWAVTKEYSVGAGTNAQDIAVFADYRAYVARLQSPSLLVVHPTEGTHLEEIDLTLYADADGLAEPASVYHHNGKIYVLLQRLDPSFMPTDYSSVLVLNGTTGAVEAEVRLTGLNPYGYLRYSEIGQGLVLIQTGNWGVLDGGVEYLNTSTNTVSGYVVTEQVLGGDLSDVVIASHTKGYAIIGGTSTSVVIFNPTTGQKTGDLLVSDSWVYTSLALNADRTELWITDKTPAAPGVRIFDTATDQETTAVPLNVGLPPFMACFVTH